MGHSLGKLDTVYQHLDVQPITQVFQLFILVTIIDINVGVSRHTAADEGLHVSVGVTHIVANMTVPFELQSLHPGTDSTRSLAQLGKANGCILVNKGRAVSHCTLSNAINGLTVVPTH